MRAATPRGVPREDSGDGERVESCCRQLSPDGLIGPGATRQEVARGGDDLERALGEARPLRDPSTPGADAGRRGTPDFALRQAARRNAIDQSRTKVSLTDDATQALDRRAQALLQRGDTTWTSLI